MPNKNEDAVNFKSTSDGWRGVMSDNFTFQNIDFVIRAVSKYIKKNKLKKHVAVGHDTRFMSDKFADYIVKTFLNEGISVDIFKNPLPTPMVSYHVKKHSLSCGIMITASHNPPEYNGIKIRMGYGGAPINQIINQIEKLYRDTNNMENVNDEFAEAIYVDPIKEYKKDVTSKVDLSNINSKKINILVDSMHGTTKNILKKILKKQNVYVKYINSNYDPLFGGIPPEPKYETTAELQKIISSGMFDFGIAHDGDGDRIIAVTKKHGYLSPHDISALLLLYIYKYKKITGKVLVSSTLGRRVRTLCKYFNIECEEFSVGFKNATEKMLEEKVLLAAEENGGVGFGFHMPERDATFAALLLLEAQISVKGGLDKLLDDLIKICGKSGFSRANFTPRSDRKTLFSIIRKQDFSQIFNTNIKTESIKNGVKMYFENNDWFCIRYSGTEKIIRIYAESSSKKMADQITNTVLTIINSLDK